ncbi:hypothetical protein AB0M46_44845 [Dactylosporangium sp. NPDC051485]|uniref:hypothetical protein n=1 Tax=Dactylosporangium sp. NPDC051485 TaxID=3154846 RepID=UPI003433627B
MLTPETVAGLTAGLTQYATSRRGPLAAPEFQIIAEYHPANGPNAFDFNLIHESVWRNWDSDRALPARVGVAEFSNLLIATAAQWLPQHQPDPRFTVVGFTLMYDDPTGPAVNPSSGPGPDQDAADTPILVLIAADIDGRRYNMILGDGQPGGAVQVTEPGMPVPAHATLTGSSGAARAALDHLVGLTASAPGRDVTDQHDPADRPDTGPLVPGEIVTVRGDRWDEEQRAQLWVVVDDFDDYAIAVLGGDGYQWRRVPRHDLTPVTPTRIRREIRADATYRYVDADTAAPVEQTVALPAHQIHTLAPPADPDGAADVLDAR